MGLRERLRAWWIADLADQRGSEWLTRDELATMMPGEFVEYDPPMPGDPEPVICGDVHPLLEAGELCVLPPGHPGRHRARRNSTWA